MDKPPTQFNFGIDWNREIKKPIVCMPIGPKFSDSVQKIVDEGRAKNLALMLKYR